MLEAQSPRRILRETALMVDVLLYNSSAVWDWSLVWDHRPSLLPQTDSSERSLTGYMAPFTREEPPRRVHFFLNEPPRRVYFFLNEPPRRVHFFLNEPPFLALELLYWMFYWQIHWRSSTKFRSVPLYRLLNKRFPYLVSHHCTFSSSCPGKSCTPQEWEPTAAASTTTLETRELPWLPWRKGW